MYLRLYDICPLLGLPFDKFHEDIDSLGGLLTSCCVVVPESIYGALNWKEANERIGLPGPVESYFYVPADDPINYRVYQKDTPTWELITLIKSCPLAR